MKIELVSTLPGVGKAGDVIEVSQEQGSALVCQGAASVVEFDPPGKGVKKAFVGSPQERRKATLDRKSNG